MILVIWLGFALWTAHVASKKGRHGGGWFVLGCLFGIFALIAAYLMSDLNERREQLRLLAKIAGEEPKQLPKKQQQAVDFNRFRRWAVEE